MADSSTGCERAINGSLGYEAGFELVRVVAARLRAAAGEPDIVVRLGSDEWVIFCVNQDRRHALASAWRVAYALRAPVEIGSGEILLRANIGVAAMTSALASPGELLSNADAAARHARERGPGTVELFDEVGAATIGGKDRARERLAPGPPE
jgi:diguanylate cyclase (GGDEF)-like protein